MASEDIFKESESEELMVVDEPAAENPTEEELEPTTLENDDGKI